MVVCMEDEASGRSCKRKTLTPIPSSAVVQLVINEISSSAPQALQAVKLLAQYQGGKLPKVCPHLLPAPVAWPVPETVGHYK
jgi:hypothetical protein